MYITIIVVLFIVIIGLGLYIYQMRKKLHYVSLILDDIESGNLDRKLIARNHSELSQISYKVNEIVAKYKIEIMNLQQSEKAYKQLVTNLSHDIRTPLASLMGYLSAIEDEIVMGDEKDEYFKLSCEKAVTLKNYIDTLFEWLKLESGERIFNFEKLDICELNREIMIEWIPQLEQNKIQYQINIPNKEIEVLLDESSYRRIMNNLMQNIILHSQGDYVKISMNETDEKICVMIEDNGIGISKKDLPHIFQRLYKCDSARRSKGNGLGLSIVSELIKANKGLIKAKSEVGEGCIFTLEYPKTCKSQD